jgi:hypothetical protein
MEDRHILRRVLSATAIFGAATLCVELLLASTKDISLHFLLALAMWPVWLVCWLFGLDVGGSISKLHYPLFIVNAVLYMIAYSIFHWLIITRGRPLPTGKAVVRVTLSALLFGTAFLASEEMVGAMNPDSRSLLGSVFHAVYGPAQDILWRLGLKDLAPWRHLAMGATAVLYTSLFAAVHWNIIKHKTNST